MQTLTTTLILWKRLPFAIREYLQDALFYWGSPSFLLIHLDKTDRTELNDLRDELRQHSDQAAAQQPDVAPPTPRPRRILR